MTTVQQTEAEKHIANIIEDQAKQINELQNTVNALSIKLQITTDLTDDLIGTSSSVVSQAGNVVSTSNNIMSHVDTVLGWYLGIFTLLVTILITFITLWIGKSRTQHVEEATKKILDDLLDNEAFRDEFIDKLASHPNIGKNIDVAIKKVASDVVKNEMKNKFQKMTDGIGE